MLRISLLAALLALGCARNTRGAGAMPVGIPADLAPAIARAEKIGRLMFENDVVSARATDVLVDAKVIGSDPSLQGWITVPAEGGGWNVQFISETPDGLRASYEVKFPANAARESDVERHSPPKVLEPRVDAMFRARGTALDRLTGYCGTGVNPLVLPAELIGKQGWLVYLLGSSNVQGEVIVAGHKLFLVSEDGGTVLEEIALSKTCLIYPPASPDRSPVALVVTHVVNDHPIETHVFTSLLYRTQVAVGTERGVWMIEDGKVRLIKAR